MRLFNTAHIRQDTGADRGWAVLGVETAAEKSRLFFHLLLAS